MRQPDHKAISTSLEADASIHGLHSKHQKVSRRLPELLLSWPCLLLPALDRCMSNIGAVRAYQLNLKYSSHVAHLKLLATCPAVQPPRIPGWYSNTIDKLLVAMYPLDALMLLMQVVRLLKFLQTDPRKLRAAASISPMHILATSYVPWQRRCMPRSAQIQTSIVPS